MFSKIRSAMRVPSIDPTMRSEVCKHEDQGAPSCGVHSCKRHWNVQFESRLNLKVFDYYLSIAWLWVWKFRRETKTIFSPIKSWSTRMDDFLQFASLPVQLGRLFLTTSCSACATCAVINLLLIDRVSNRHCWSLVHYQQCWSTWTHLAFSRHLQDVCIFGIIVRFNDLLYHAACSPAWTSAS